MPKVGARCNQKNRLKMAFSRNGYYSWSGFSRGVRIVLLIRFLSAFLILKMAIDTSVSVSIF